jgi:hypothetical protein
VLREILARTTQIEGIRELFGALGYYSHMGERASSHGSAKYARTAKVTRALIAPRRVSGVRADRRGCKPAARVAASG